MSVRTICADTASRHAGPAGPRRRARRRVLRLPHSLLLGAVVLLLPAPTAGQDFPFRDRPDVAGRSFTEDATCPLGVVSRIEIRNHSIFAPEDLHEHRLGPALRLVNWAHIRTRASYLRHEILLSEGDCWEPAALDESLRRIRERPFIARAEGTPSLQPDSTWLVFVETWDEWTTQLSLDFHVQDQVQFKRMALRERNFGGMGLTAALDYHRFREHDDRSFTLATTRFLGTRTNASMSAGATRTGSRVSAGVGHPFGGEQGRVEFGSVAWLEDREFSFLATSEGRAAYVLVPLRDRVALSNALWRWGEPGALTQLGGEVNIVRRTVGGRPRLVMDGDFDGAGPAPDSVVGRLGRQLHPNSWVKVGMIGGFRRMRFTTRRGLELVSGVQDFALGTDVRVTLGRTVETWGSSPLDTYGALRGFVSGAAEPFSGLMAVSVDVRRVDTAPPGLTPWRDVVVAATAIGFVQPGDGWQNTSEATVRFTSWWNADSPFQLTLGGPEGVRSYRDDELPTGTVLVGRFEHRVNLAWLQPAMDLGLTLFGDAGRGWSNRIPFAVDTGWRGAVGAGLRIGFPAGTTNVTRVELAWPTGGPGARRQPVFRVYVTPVRTRR